MMINPELQRHAWVELNWQRLLVTGGVLSLVFLLTWFFDDYHFANHTNTIALTLFVIANYFYGSHLAGDSLLQEMIGHTWDYQRLSAQSAWTISWGKIIGANLYVWLVSGVALLFVTLSLEANQYFLWGGMVPYLFKLVGLGLALHALSLLFGLAMIRKQPTPSKRHYNGLRFLFLFILLSFFISFDAAVAEKRTLLFWYTIPWHLPDFILFCIALTLFWSWMGAWRMMEEELQFRQTPWAWGAFTLFAALFAGGLGLGSNTNGWWHSFSMQGFWVVLSLSYVATFLTSKDPLLFRRMAQHWSEGWLSRLTVSPIWLISLILTTLWLFFVLISSSASPWKVPWHMPDYGPSLDMMIWLDSKALAIALFFLMLRDLSIMIWVNTHPHIRRSDGAIMVYLVVIYLLLPILIGVTEAKNLLFLFLPQANMPLASIGAAVAQSLPAMALLYFAQRRCWQEGQ